VWIDIAKAVAIIGVIVGHTVGGPLRDLIFSFHMPIFFVLAGYTFRLKPLAEVTRSSAKRLLVPYVLIWLATSVMRSGLAVNSISVSTEMLRLLWATGYSETASIPVIGMPWFLMVLFVCRVLFDAVQPRLERLPLWGQGLVWLAVAAVGAGVGQITYLPLGIDTALAAVFFLWCGYAAKKIDLVEHVARTGGVRTALPCFVVMLVVWLACTYLTNFEFATRVFTYFPLCLVGALAGSAVVVQFAVWVQDLPWLAWLRRPLAYIGLNCMLLYCFHALDWWTAAWSQLSLFANLPFTGLFESIVRFCYDFGLVLLVRAVK
jgi:fucose 4-O-acetylase-like acetyltransferase